MLSPPPDSNARLATLPQKNLQVEDDDGAFKSYWKSGTIAAQPPQLCNGCEQPHIMHHPALKT